MLMGSNRQTNAPVGRKGIRFLFRNPVAEPYFAGTRLRALVGVTQNDPETPAGGLGRVVFSL